MVREGAWAAQAWQLRCCDAGNSLVLRPSDSLLPLSWIHLRRHTVSRWMVQPCQWQLGSSVPGLQGLAASQVVLLAIGRDPGGADLRVAATSTQCLPLWAAVVAVCRGLPLLPPMPLVPAAQASQ